jgi:hypothetical protein
MPAFAAASLLLSLVSALPLQIVRDGGRVDGTCVLIQQEPRASDVALYFLTVLRLEDRSVNLRFTLGGAQPSPPSPPAACPQGQALVSVHLIVVVARPPE